LRWTTRKWTIAGMRKALGKLWLSVLVLLPSIALTRSASAANWYDGMVTRVPHVCDNFISQTTEDLAWIYAGFQDVDDGGTTRLPRTGETYYVRVVMAGLGCSGAWAMPEITLPKGTTPAITQSTPIRCFSEKIGLNNRAPLTPCPTQLLPGQRGQYALPPPTQPYWPLPHLVVSIEVPVKSSVPLSGIATNDYVIADVNILDNNPGGGNPPWSQARQGVFVTQAGAPPAPYVAYADNGAKAQTTTATTDATLFNIDCVVNGDLRTDVLPIVDQPDGTQFVGAQCIAGCCTPPCAAGSSVTYRFSWNNMTPDRAYKWRAYLQNLQVLPSCSRTLADAQTNAQAPQWATFRTQPTNPKPAAFQLMLRAGPGGTITAEPPPPAGSTRYAPGTKVTVTASPADGFRLAVMLRDGTPTASPLELTMDADTAVEATFEPGSASGADGGTASAPAKGGCSSAGVPAQGAVGAFAFAGLALAAWRRRCRRAESGSPARN